MAPEDMMLAAVLSLILFIAQLAFSIWNVRDNNYRGQDIIMAILSVVGILVALGAVANI